MSEKIYAQINDKKIELKGADLEAFLEQRAKDQAESAERERLLEAELTKKQADKDSAISKLKKLGLTDDEVSSLIP